jgi:hypothetical protein
MLWWSLTTTYLIPTWGRCVGQLGQDAHLRMTSTRSQLSLAAHHAALQEMTLQTFGERLRHAYPKLYRKKCLGAACYWILAGRRDRAASFIKSIDSIGRMNLLAAFQVLAWIPLPVVKLMFTSYRTLTTR